MPLRVRLAVTLTLSLAGMLALAVADARQGAPGDDPHFTGVSTVMESKDLSAARRRFEPGARSAWHSHDNGQLLYVEEGRMRTQKRGQPMKELEPGASDYTGPHVEHWHGAAPNTHLIQVNIGFGGDTRWLARTTDDEYAGKLLK